MDTMEGFIELKKPLHGDALEFTRTIESMVDTRDDDIKQVARNIISAVLKMQSAEQEHSEEASEQSKEMIKNSGIQSIRVATPTSRGKTSWTEKYSPRQSMEQSPKQSVGQGR